MGRKVKIFKGNTHKEAKPTSTFETFISNFVDKPGIQNKVSMIWYVYINKIVLD